MTAKLVVAVLGEDWTRYAALGCSPMAHVCAGASMTGLGDTLHVFVGNDWYQVRLSSLV